MYPKTKKTGTPWAQCEKCSANILLKDADHHSLNCPPNLENLTHNFIYEDTFYGTVDVKSNEDIRGVSTNDKDNMVFLSQSVIQLLNVCIGDWLALCNLNKPKQPVARVVWPTTEKSLTSVLLTSNSITLTNFSPNSMISISKLAYCPREALQVALVVLNGPKNLEISGELHNRIHKLCFNRIIAIHSKLSIMYYGKLLIFEIKSIHSERAESVVPILEMKLEALSINKECDFYKVVDRTSWKLFRSNSEYKKKKETADPFVTIGGLADEIGEIQDLMNSALCTGTQFPFLKRCHGVLLYGISGTGKTVLANALARAADVNVVTLSAADLYTKQIGTPCEQIVKSAFEEATRNAPCVILLDDVDVLCPTRTSRLTDTDRKVVSTVLMLFDNLLSADACKVFVLGTSNKPDFIDPAFRRCGRFDREIEIPIPNPQGRFDILQKLLSNTPHNINSGGLREIANAAHGFVGADLVSLCSRASLRASKRGLANLEYEDLKYALTRVKPSAMRDVQVEVPSVKWSDIGGQERLKLILRQSVEWPLKHYDSFIRLGITPPKGVLMFGPPGCSKTMIAKALATESGLNFLSIKGPELFSKWVGESERAVREVFRKARQVAPSIIFFDEIDAVGGERSSGSSTSVQERVLAQLLTELDGVTSLGDVTIVAATNRPDRIDQALLRPGRLDRIVYVPLPDASTRLDIFKIKLQKMPVVDVCLEELVSKTCGYSGAEVNAVCHEAAMKALEDDINASHVEMRHFQEAFDLITPRTSSSLIDIYENYVKQCG